LLSSQTNTTRFSIIRSTCAAMADFTDSLKPAEPRGPDTLAKERSESSLPVKELACHLFSRDGFLDRQQRILREVQKERLLSKTTQQNLSRPDRYKLGLARAKLLRRMARKLGWSEEDHKMYVPSNFEVESDL
jgi:acyl-CoA oxidase